MSNVHIDKLRRAVIAASLVGAAIFAESAFSAQPVFEGAEVVEFGSAAFTHTPSPFRIKQAKKLGIALESTIEPSVPLTGYLARPVGEGPFPAVVTVEDTKTPPGLSIRWTLAMTDSLFSKRCRMLWPMTTS